MPLSEKELIEKVERHLEYAVVHHSRGKSSAETVPMEHSSEDSMPDRTIGLWSRQEHLHQAGHFHLDLTVRLQGKTEEGEEERKWLWRMMAAVFVVQMLTMGIIAWEHVSRPASDTGDEQRYREVGR